MGATELIFLLPVLSKRRIILKNENRKFSPNSNEYIYMLIDDEDFEEKRREAWRKRRLVPRKRTNRDNRYIRLKNHENSTTTSSDESSTSTTKNVYYEPIRTKPDLMKYVWNLPQKSLAVFASKYNQQEKYCKHIVIFMYTMCNF